MGCLHSTPILEGKTERKSHSLTTGGTERLMGSTNRKHSQRKDEKVPPKVDTDGQLLPEEVVKRTACSENRNVTIGKPGKGNMIRMQYAYWTQQGWYPEDPHKANQDDYSITHKFGAESDDILFGIYDGHGLEGHSCSNFAKENLPQLIAKYISKKRAAQFQAILKQKGESTKASFNPRMWPKLSVKDYEECCRKGFIKCNQKMHDDKNVDDRVSGTTAITAGFHFGRLTVCNVGDSRAVMGHRVSGGEEEEKTEIGQAPVLSTKVGKLVALPLSTDQTPYRTDERERVKKAGSAVMTVDQMEGRVPVNEDWDHVNMGEEIDMSGDPPRVWAKGYHYPGCAFTRSLGDLIAERIGVYAEPEILTKEVTRNDEILVIASDGIFEFITNQGVIDMCAECKSPLEACERLVKSSYSKWLHIEERTDDITVIVCFLQCDSETETAEGTTKELVKSNNLASAKPTRKRERKTDGRSLSLFVPEDGAEALQRRVLEDFDASSDEADEEKKVTESSKSTQVFEA